MRMYACRSERTREVKRRRRKKKGEGELSPQRQSFSPHIQAGLHTVPSILCCCCICTCC